MQRVVKRAAVLIALGASFAVLAATRSEAAELDLTAGGVTLSPFAGALWSTTEIQPTGSGYIDSFVRIQDASSGTRDVVDGMNTSGELLNDEKPGPTFTHDVLLSDVTTKTINGTAYYEFLLDINQEGGDPLLTLSGLQLCTSSANSLSFVDSCGGNDTAPPDKGRSTLKYDMGLGGATGYADGSGQTITHDESDTTNQVLMDYGLNSGSGSGDLFVYVPVATLGLADNQDNKYLYLWSQFGAPIAEGNTNNDGYEEWAFLNKNSGSDEPFNGNEVPEPGSLVLLGTGLLFGGHLIRRRSQKQQASKAE